MALKSKQDKMEHFSNVSELMTLPPFDGATPEAKILATALFDVKSSYFKANIEVVLSERKRQLTSHLMRKNKRVQVYARSLAPF